MSELDNSKYRTRSNLLVLISAVVALFSPVGMNVISHPLGEFAASLIGVFWTAFMGSPIPIDGGSIVPPTVNPASGLTAVPLIALRFLFVFQLYRLYNGKTSRRAAISFGILSELFLVILNIPGYISSVLNPPFTEIYLPLPFLLLIGYLIIKIYPPFVASTPWETHD
ncbi:MAG: hypothetical protein ACFFDQ_02945 [Candidatus Thorarchaeota archaeon]